ncbi:glycosyltransferase [Litorisediminicola beolgyonensis]|uniref:Glycosyltransferase n=1 Tax=Litorisediminicola beolgyonensis TaxID=1173614 RepID=A0ABW3ZPS8_9RHOB
MNERARTGAGRLVAVVVTHNRPHQLRVTLARLLEAPEAELAAVVVVDNASSDGETGRVLDAMSGPRLDVFRSETNLGGAGGFEQGMRRAMAEHAPDWLVVMDDDARPEPGALAAFHACDLAGWEGVGAAVYCPDGSICDMNRPAFNPFRSARLFLRTAMGGGREAFHLGPEDYRGPERRVDILSFVGLFLSRAAVERVGYPDPGLFLYGDDLLYTLGLTEAGGRLKFAPGVRFEHDFTSHKGGVKRFVPLWKCYYHHRNLLMIYRRIAGPLFWPALLLILPKWLSKIRHYSGERRLFLRLIGAALRDGLAGRTGTDHATVVARFTR